MKKLKLALVAIVLVAASGCEYIGVEPTPTAVVQPGPAPTQGPPASPAPQPTTPPQPTAVPPSGGINFCNKTFPSGSVLFSVGKPNDDRYSIVFDPSQSGVAGREPRGWYYQPCLPPSRERVEHELTLVLQPGRYDFTGPECTVWLNTTGTDTTSWEKGRLLIDRQNVVVDVPPTNGRNESWVAVRCKGGAASGFSFSRL